MTHGTPPRVFHFPKITIVILSLVAERLEDMREKLIKIGAFVAVAGMALTGLANELPYIYGAQYYRAPTPAREHWAGDLAAIKAKGFNTVKYWVQWRWSERVEGEYVWDDLDELMVLAEKNDLKVVLNLILDVMPEWVEGKHPDALMVDLDGRRIGPTAPAHRQLNGYPGPCYSHAEVTAKRQRFTRAAYEHFKRFPALFAWDVWNEPERMAAHRTNDHVPALCFCENCKRDFKVWLKARYGTIEKLNAVWGRCYTSFDAVETPVDVCCVTDFIDWREFQKDVLQRDADWRLNLLREIDPARHPHLHVVLACGIFSPAVAVDDFEIARKCELFGSTMMNQPYACAQGISAAQGRFYYNAEWHLNYGSINRYQRVIGRDAFLYDQFAQIGWGIKGCLFWQYRPESLGIEAPAWGLVRSDGSDRPVVRHAEEFIKAFAPYAETYLRCRRPDAKVLVWRSARNEIFQYCRYNNVSRYHAGLGAWCDALYDLNVPFGICDTEMLEGGAGDKADVLILSQAMYLTERDAQAFRKFANVGKTIISEMNLGAYDADKGRFSGTVPGIGLAEAWDVKETETTAVFHLPTTSTQPAKVHGMDDVAKAMQASRAKGEDYFKFTCVDGSEGVGAHDFASIGTVKGEVLGSFRDAPVAVGTRTAEGARIFYCGTQLGVAAAEKDAGVFLRHALASVLREVGAAVDDRHGLHVDVLSDPDGQPRFKVFINRGKDETEVDVPQSGWKRLLGDKGEKLPPNTAALYVRDGLASSRASDPFGKWALQLPYGCFNAGCLDIGRSLTGEPQALLLWRGGSPIVVPVAISDNRISFVCESNRVVLEAEGDRLSGAMNGDKPIRGWRIEPIGARPDLSEARFGKAENLLDEGMDGFSLMGEKSGWTFENGVLANHVERDADGKRIGRYGNLVTKRSDFFDFNLKCDVRVPAGSNSGIYLRGIYEIQVIDSFGKPLDQHGMGALYGRIAPSVAAERKPGEWQTLDITLWRRHLTVVLNGITIIDNKPVEGITGGALTPDESKPGPIYLQGDHSDADYRNLVLTKILN